MSHRLDSANFFWPAELGGETISALEVTFFVPRPRVTYTIGSRQATRKLDDLFGVLRTFKLSPLTYEGCSQYPTPWEEDVLIKYLLQMSNFGQENGAPRLIV